MTVPATALRRVYPQEARVLSSRSRRSPLLAVAATSLALVVAACSGGAATPAPSATPVASPTEGASGSPAATPAAELTKLVVGLGYIPNVQFAQFYLADQAGYYEEAGLEVELQNKIDPDLITLIGQGAIDIGSADGTSVIPAGSQGIPIIYTATIYGTFPSIVYAKKSSGIESARDLAGKKIGIPGKFGSSWVMLQALLESARLTVDDVEIVLYPDFGQGVALQQGAVDAATGFANNEPVQLELSGEEAVVLNVDQSLALPGPGLVTATATLEAKRDALAAFVAATLRAMDEIAADPQVGLDAAFAAVPDLAADPETQRAVLDATIETWYNRRTQQPLGSIDRAGWWASTLYMQRLGIVTNPVPVEQLVTEELLP